MNLGEKKELTQREACRYAGIGHDTLHWGVSTKLNEGWSLEDAQAFRGHDSRQSTEKYRTIDLTEVAKRRAAK